MRAWAPLGMALAALACSPTTTRSRVTPFPESPHAEVRADRPESTERLLAVLVADSIPVARHSLRDGWIETAWLDTAGMRPTTARPYGTGIVKLRGWVDPGRIGYSVVTLEGSWRALADPSLPDRELERPLPANHPVRQRLDTLLARIPKGR